MSAHPIIELRCDAPGCTAAVATGQRRVCDARAEATGAGGWYTVDVPGSKGPGRQLVVRKDYCPDCGAAALARIA